MGMARTWPKVCGDRHLSAHWSFLRGELIYLAHENGMTRKDIGQSMNLSTDAVGYQFNRVARWVDHIARQRKK